MMPDTGALGVWAAGKKVGGGMVGKPRSRRSSSMARAPRSVRRVASTPRNEAVLFVGFASPIAHFAELGTIKEPARPFLTPALNRGTSGPRRRGARDGQAHLRPALARPVTG